MGEYCDPFADEPWTPRSCIVEDTVGSTNIDTSLFDPFFSTAEFLAWSSGTKPWQLHCSGPPGCGKTELARAAVRILRKQHPIDVVTCIFVRGDNALPGTYVLEDFLEAMEDQLAAQLLSSRRRIRSKRSTSRPIRDRILSLEIDIRKQLSSRSDKNKRIFLIIDGYDTIDESLHIFIERLLLEFHQYGLRTMMTRRVPAFKPAVDAVCDDCPDHRRRMNTYWVCSYCKSNGQESWQCYDCRDSRRVCFRCSGDQFEEDKPFVHVPIGVSRASIRQYIWKELETEFKHVDSTMCQQITEHIMRRADCNITLVRLYLEQILAQPSLLDFDSQKMFDRLPGNLIEFLDAEFGYIKELPEEQGKVARLSITLVSKGAVRLGDFAKALQPHVIPLRNIEDVLRLARGWIVMEDNTTERELSISATVATLYINEGYDNLFTIAGRLVENHVDSSSRPESPQNDDIKCQQIQNNDAVSKRPTQNLIRLNQITMFPGRMDIPSSGSDFSILGSSRGTSFTTTSTLPTASTAATSFTEGDQFPMLHTGLSEICCTLEEFKARSPSRMDTGERMNSPLSQVVTSSGSPREFPFTSYPADHRLCRFCSQSFLASEELSGTYESLLRKGMCVLCQALCNLSPRSTSFSWSLRSSPHSNPEKRFFTLSFRSNGSDPHSTRSKRFHLFRENIVPTIDKFSIGLNTAPECTGTRIKGWLRDCDESHPHCKKYSYPSFAPKRLLDLQSPDPNRYKIIETDMSINEPYCTLSHSWGKEKFITSTRENIDDHMERGVPREKLPTNFVEAVDVVKELGVRYIWIDSLCIVQGDGGDFQTQGNLMHKVYRNSYCNIVAADSEAAKDGLFRSRSPDQMIPASYSVHQPNSILGSIGETWKIIPDDFWDSDLLQSHIYGRGWVFQERLLSPRLLHFARDQIYWDCATISACESLPFGLPVPLDDTASKERHWRGRLALDKTKVKMSGSFDNESPYTFWLAAVESYTSCDLTNKSDKGTAIWSVAKILRDDVFDPPEDYAMGMWSKNFVEQLAWRSANAEGNKRLVELQVDYPSWSWFSVHGKIIPHERQFKDRKYWITGRSKEELSFHVESQKDDDQQPKLSRESLSVLAHVHPVAVQAKEMKGLEHEVSMTINGQEITLSAFLDDCVTSSQFFTSCEFVLLATSKSRTEQTFDSASIYDDEDSNTSIEEREDEGESHYTSGDDDADGETFSSENEQDHSSDDDDDDEEEEEEEESDSFCDTASFEDTWDVNSDQYYQTYSGTGLLIVRSDRWLSVQEHRVDDLRRRYHVPQGQPAHSKREDGAVTMEIAASTKSPALEKDASTEHRYRRIGMVSFENMSQEIFSSITGNEPSKIWLD